MAGYIAFMATLLLAQLIHAFQLNTSPCINPKIRKEWRSLSVNERMKYLQAVNCMMSTPPKFKKHFAIVESRYEDFVALHVNATLGDRTSDEVEASRARDKLSPGPPKTPFDHIHHGIHREESFLPWHRYILSLWEDALNTECGWEGAVPCEIPKSLTDHTDSIDWNWHLDTPERGGSLPTSPVLDPISGFGGNGKKIDPNPSPHPGTGGGCIFNGPFSNHTLRIGPHAIMKLNNTRCLTRDFRPQDFHSSASKNIVAQALKSETFAELQENLERPPSSKWGWTLHSSGHLGIGGEMADAFSSINDPLFFVHHGGLDYIWALWQDQDPKRVQAEKDMDAVRGRLRDVPLWMGVFAPQKSSLEVLDTLNRNGKGFLCYRYEGLEIKDYQ